MSIFNFNRGTTHVGFADEAYWNRGEFRAVACVSTRLDNRDYHEVERRLCASRCEAGAIVSEIKWSDTRTRDRQRDAAAALEAALRLAAHRTLHIDVLIWDGQGREYLDRLLDTPDNRETMHLQMMYRFLFSQVIAGWLSADPTVVPHWTLAPDRQEGVDFPTVQRDLYLDPALPGGAVVNVVDVKAALNYSLQLADLIAGLAAYSHQGSDDYEVWLHLGKKPELQLTVPQWPTRFPLLDQFTQQCQDRELGLTMLSDNPVFPGRGLWSPDPASTQHTMNFQPFTLS